MFDNIKNQENILMYIKICSNSDTPLFLEILGS